MEYARTIFENDVNVNAAEVLNKLDKGIYDTVRAALGMQVWKNGDTTAVFEKQDIAVDADMPTHFEVLFYVSNTITNMLTTGKIPVEEIARMQALDTHVYWRTAAITQNDDGTLTVSLSVCTRRTISSSPASSTQNAFVIPVAIKLYYE